MKKFDAWNLHKKNIQRSNNYPIFYEREIWHCRLGLNIGFEQDRSGEEYMRHILVFKKFNTRVFWGIPLTRTLKSLPMYFAFSLNDGVSVAILSQVKLLDSKRLSNKFGNMNKNDFKNLQKKFKDITP